MVAVVVVVVAGSLFTLVDGLLEEVSASAAIDLFEASDAFLQDSAPSLFGRMPPPCGPRDAAECGGTGKSCE